MTRLTPEQQAALSRGLDILLGPADSEPLSRIVHTRGRTRLVTRKVETND